MNYEEEVAKLEREIENLTEVIYFYVINGGGAGSINKLLYEDAQLRSCQIEKVALERSLKIVKFLNA